MVFFLKISVHLETTVSNCKEVSGINKSKLKVVKDTYLVGNYSINCKGNLIDLSTPKIMSIVNTTPDSFYDGGKYNTIEKALQKVELDISNNTTFIDVGGYSLPAHEIVIEPVEGSNSVTVEGNEYHPNLVFKPYRVFTDEDGVANIPLVKGSKV